MNATLVIMAAGLGSRYGGEKQIDGLGPNGEIIMEYSAYDAIRAGFHKIVFILKKPMLDTVKSLCGDRLAAMTARDGAPVQVEYVFQDFDSLPSFYTVPEGRTKPFGTVHAALCARKAVNEPFALINADDFYGYDAFATMYQALTQMDRTGQGAMVGYRLKNTVSDHGTVTRGVCLQKDGKLDQLKETYQIKKYPDGRICDTENPAEEKPLEPDTLVSMNFWGFLPWIFSEMESYFHTFLQTLSPQEQKAECLLPALVDQLIHQGKMQVSVLTTDAVWFGVTYQADRPLVTESLKRLHAAGQYPPSLRT